MAKSKAPEHPHVAEKIDELLEHEDESRIYFVDLIDNTIRGIGYFVCFANGALLAVIIIQVVLRYVFQGGLTSLEELQWHLYAIGVMMGMSYAQVNDNHVRVDVFYSHFSDRAKRLVEIFSILFLVLPFVFVIFYHSLDFVYDAWRTGESSPSPGGLPHRWAIKSVIPISFGLLGIASVSRLIRDIYLLTRGKVKNGK